MSEKTIISTDKAPAPVGPYSQAVVAGGFVFTAGQVSIDPGTNKPVHDDVAGQTKRVMENVKALLEAAGTSLDNVVKTTIYVADMADFTTVNGVYASFFQKAPPARSTTQAAGLPLGLKVEIDVVATV